MVKNSPANAGDISYAGLIPGSGRSPGEGNGNPLQYSCLENPMDRGAWRATVHWVSKSRTTELKMLSTEFPGSTVDKNLPASAGDTGLILGPGRFHTLQST